MINNEEERMGEELRAATHRFVEAVGRFGEALLRMVRALRRCAQAWRAPARALEMNLLLLWYWRTQAQEAAVRRRTPSEVAAFRERATARRHRP